MSLLVVALFALVLLVTTLTRARPSWWASPSFEPGVGERVEHAALRHLTSLRAMHRTTPPPARGTARGPAWASEPWSVSISEEDAGAWLAQRFPEWSHSRAWAWPRELGATRVRFLEGRVLAAIELRDRADTRVLWAEVEPVIDDSGELWLRARRVGVGRVPLPRGLVLDGLGRALGREGAGPSTGALLPEGVRIAAAMRDVGAILQGERAALHDPVLRLDAGRRVRILGLRVHEGRLEMTARTEVR